MNGSPHACGYVQLAYLECLLPLSLDLGEFSRKLHLPGGERANFCLCHAQLDRYVRVVLSAPAFPEILGQDLRGRETHNNTIAKQSVVLRFLRPSRLDRAKKWHLFQFA